MSFPYQPPSPQQYPPQQYPPQQYPPMTFDYYQPAGAGDVLGPNRRAAGMMFVVAAVTLLGAFCCAGVGAMLPQMMAQNPAAFADIEAQLPGIGTDTLRMLMIVAAVLVLLLAAAFAALGVFVRKGSKAAVVMSIVLVFLVLGYLLINMLATVVQQRVPGPQLGMTLCMMAVPMGLLGFVLMLLFGALRSSDQARVLREQQMQQYWQYAYQQQMYAQQQMQQQQQQGQQGQRSWPETGVAEPTPPPGQQQQQQQTWPGSQEYPPSSQQQSSSSSPPPPPGGPDATPPNG